MTTGTTPETEALVQSNAAAADTDLEITAPANKNWLEWGLLAALIVVMLAQLWTSVTQLSITCDEINHLHAAYRYWQCNDFGWNPEHPPLMKIVAGLPLEFMHINDPIPHACGAPNTKGIDFNAGHQFIFANPEKMLTRARFAVSLFPVLLLVSVWFFARKMFGLPVAIVCGVLVAFEPNLLAHGALITTDAAASLGFLLAMYALYGYAIEPNFTRLLALGLATGFALCTKHSSILLAVILPTVLAADAILFPGDEPRRRLLRYAGALLVAFGIAFVVLWAAYGFRYAARPGGAAVWTPEQLHFAHGVVATKIVPQLERWRLAPQAYIAGLQDVMVRSELGVRSFVLGKSYPHGRWFYFPIAAAIKSTLSLLLMVVFSAFSWRFWKRNLRELLFLTIPVVVYFTFSMGSNLNIGSRHLLPVLPLLIIFAAAGAWNIAHAHRWVMAVLVGLLVFHAVSSLHSYPNYLSYSNELWGGPSQTYRYLAYSDADWGQAQKMARAYIDKTHPSNCFFLRTYHNLNSDYGIPCGGISQIQWDQLQTPFTGTMIVSSNFIDGVELGGLDRAARRVFKDLKPTAKLGGSALLVYQGTLDLSPLVAFQLLYQAKIVGEGDPQLSLQYAEKAAALDPSNGDAHVVMCGSYHALGQDDKAEQECNIGLNLVRKDPQYGPQQIKYLEDFITNKGLKIYNSQAGSSAQ